MCTSISVLSTMQDKSHSSVTAAKSALPHRHDSTAAPVNCLRVCVRECASVRVWKEEDGEREGSSRSDKLGHRMQMTGHP